MKFATILFSILIFINGLLLTFQYHVFSTNSSEEEKAYHYTQDIEIVYKGNFLYINQVFSGLPEKAVKIDWPKESKVKSCGKSSQDTTDSAGCDRLDKTLTTITDGGNSKQAISYRIAVSKKGVKNGQFFSDIFASLKKGIADQTSIQMVDEKRIGGQWYTGLPKIGEQSLTLVDYAYFKGDGSVYELYWQKKKQAKAFDSKELTVYTDKIKNTNLKQSLKTLKVLNNGHLDIIEANKNKNGKRIVFTGSLSKKQLQERVVTSQILKKYKFQGNSEQLSNIIASYATDSLIGSNKSKKMVENLNEYFNSEQKTLWSEGLEELEGKRVDSVVLDELLSDTVSSKTSYFQLNEASGKTVVPLLFEESRAIYVNGLHVKDLKVILKGNSILYAANQILDELGYKTSVGEHGYYVKGQNLSLRFPGEEYNFFVKNNERYDLASTQPVTKVGGTYYVEESWLIRLFTLDINKSEVRVDIQDPQQKK